MEKQACVLNFSFSCFWEQRSIFVRQKLILWGGGGGVSQGHDKHFTVLIKGPYMSYISFYIDY